MLELSVDYICQAVYLSWLLCNYLITDFERGVVGLCMGLLYAVCCSLFARYPLGTTQVMEGCCILTGPGSCSYSMKLSFTASIVPSMICACTVACNFFQLKQTKTHIATHTEPISRQTFPFCPASSFILNLTSYKKSSYLLCPLSLFLPALQILYTMTSNQTHVHHLQQHHPIHP